MNAADIVTVLNCGRGGCACTRAMRCGEGNTHCPAHDDERPSLSVTGRNGRVLVHCHAGCEQRAVIEALRAMGLWR